MLSIVGGAIMFVQLIGAIAVGLITMLLVASAESTLNGGKIIKKETSPENGRSFFSFANPFKETDADGWTKAIVIGLMCGVTDFVVPRLSGWATWLAVLPFILMICLMAYLAEWWYKDATNLREMIRFILLAIFVHLLAMSSAAKLAEVVKDRFAKSLLLTFPRICVVTTICFFIAWALFFYYKHNKSADDKKAMLARYSAWVVIVVKTLLVIWLLTCIEWSRLGAIFAEASDGAQYGAEVEKTANEGGELTVVTPTPENVVLSWYGFFCWTLQQDDNPLNDYNFGPSVVIDVENGATAQEIYEIFKNRIKEDPALGAAVMAYVDAVCGTRYMGLFYSECNEHWDAAINYAKEKFMNDQMLYYGTLDHFFEFMDNAYEIRIQAGTGIEDQMYMNPYTEGAPDVIDMKTDNHEGLFFTAVFMIKGQKFEVSFRLECGFQPCNVAKIMDITPQEKPVAPTVTPKPATPKPKAPTATPKPKAPTATPTSKPNTPTPTKKLKDPTKGTKVGKNDDPGPGPDTNNGVGANTSSEDKPTNSAYKSYDEYKEAQKNLSDTNKGQKQGGDANTPVVTPKPNTKVDGNGGNIDQKTPTQGAVHVVAPDGTSQGSVSSGLGKWDGPVD